MIEWKSLKEHFRRVRSIERGQTVVFVGDHIDNNVIKFGDSMIKEEDLPRFQYTNCVVAGKRYTVSMRNIATPEEFAQIVLKKMAPEAMSVDDLPF